MFIDVVFPINSLSVSQVINNASIMHQIILILICSSANDSKYSLFTRNEISKGQNVYYFIRLYDAELIQLVYAKSSRLVYPNDVRVTFIRITTNSPTDIVTNFICKYVCECVWIYNCICKWIYSVHQI